MGARGTRGAPARGLIAGGAARVWGPGGVGARGLGRALVWTMATAGTIALSRCSFVQ